MPNTISVFVKATMSPDELQAFLSAVRKWDVAALKSRQ